MNTHRLKTILTSRGIKQKWLVDQLLKHGHKIDAARMTRICSGTIPRNLKLINDICEILDIQLTDLY